MCLCHVGVHREKSNHCSVFSLIKIQIEFIASFVPHFNISSFLWLTKVWTKGSCLKGKIIPIKDTHPQIKNLVAHDAPWTLKSNVGVLALFSPAMFPISTLYYTICSIFCCESCSLSSHQSNIQPSNLSGLIFPSPQWLTAFHYAPLTDSCRSGQGVGSPGCSWLCHLWAMSSELWKAKAKDISGGGSFSAPTYNSSIPFFMCWCCWALFVCCLFNICICFFFKIEIEQFRQK